MREVFSRFPYPLTPYGKHQWNITIKNCVFVEVVAHFRESACFQIVHVTWNHRILFEWFKNICFVVRLSLMATSLVCTAPCHIFLSKWWHSEKIYLSREISPMAFSHHMWSSHLAIQYSLQFPCSDQIYGHI